MSKDVIIVPEWSRELKDCKDPLSQFVFEYAPSQKLIHDAFIADLESLLNWIKDE